MPTPLRHAAPLAAALLACAPSPLVHPRAAEQLRRGYQHLEAGDAERADVAFRHALAFAPDLPEGWNGLGVVARTRGDLPAARRAFTKAAGLAPAFAEGHANLGEVLLAEGRPEDAAEALRAALRIDPDLAAPRLNLARAQLQQGLLEPGARPARWAAARREYLHLLEAAPGSAAAEADLAFMAYLDGRAGEAAARFGRAAALEETPAARLGECLALAALGRCAEAAPACDRCLALAPSAEGCRAARRGLAGCAAAP